jgi:hypothetical protein
MKWLLRATNPAATGIPPGGYLGKTGRSPARVDTGGRNCPFPVADHHFSALASRA